MYRLGIKIYIWGLYEISTHSIGQNYKNTFNLHNYQCREDYVYILRRKMTLFIQGHILVNIFCLFVCY